MAKKKFYVVWHGRETGIFNNWNDCRKQIENFPQAKYKSFDTRELAEQAFQGDSKDFIGKKFFQSTLTTEQLKLIGQPILDSITVDGACSGSTGEAEYQGIYTKTKETIFRKGPFEDGTNNIVEFLAIVHALAYCKQKNLTIPIYSDSKYAIAWVRDKESRTNHEKSSKNKELFDLLDRAVKWLRENKYPNKVLKWETRAWGENPADFGRK
jgi:ribonuclease HI